PDSIIYHYMDDILVYAEKGDYLRKTLAHLLKSLQKYGLQVTEEKIQTSPPWKYLGCMLTEFTVRPQHLKISNRIKTLNDLQF
ncbi:PO113 protein, partial [Neopipo cinnamomea]|nr:PO113 protein [Neopipo cinnamomea]